MRRGAVADLLPVLAVEEGYFITVDGRIGTAIVCTGINLSIQSDAAAATVAALFADKLTYLPLKRAPRAARHQQPAARR